MLPELIPNILILLHYHPFFSHSVNSFYIPTKTCLNRISRYSSIEFHMQTICRILVVIELIFGSVILKVSKSISSTPSLWNRPYIFEWAKMAAATNISKCSNNSCQPLAKQNCIDMDEKKISVKWNLDIDNIFHWCNSKE